MAKHRRDSENERDNERESERERKRQGERQREEKRYKREREKEKHRERGERGPASKDNGSEKTRALSKAGGTTQMTEKVASKDCENVEVENGGRDARRSVEKKDSKGPKRDKKRSSKVESSSEILSDSSSEEDSPSSSSSGSSSSSSYDSYDSESSSEEERRRKRRKRRQLDRQREREKERERRERERRRRKKEKLRKQEERKKLKEEKRKKKKDKTKGPVTASWGKYGLIKEIDMWNKRPEFSAWLAEVKKVNLETLPAWEEKQMFKEYMEDFNTATLPKKYYDLDAYHRRKLMKERNRSLKSGVESERTEFNDEEQRRQEVRKAREQQKEAEIEDLKRMMQSGMAQAMREQAQLREEMQYQYRLGNLEAAAAIQRRLDPDASNQAVK